MIPTVIVTSSALVMATVRCQDFPFFPKQSRCVSQKLVGMNFIAQSIISSTCDGFRLSIVLLLAVSCELNEASATSTLLDASQLKSCCNFSRLSELKMERVALVNIMMSLHHKFLLRAILSKNKDSSLTCYYQTALHFKKIFSLG